MKSFGLTDTGKKREKNEDSIRVDDSLGLYIVADGMGGHMLGEVASQTAVDTLKDSIETALLSSDTAALKQDDHIFTLLREAVIEANRKIYEYSQNLPRKGIMGTTVSLGLVRNGKIYMAHVGDSRIYRLRKDSIEKLTKDHSKAQELVDAGLLKEEEADSHRSSHVLTKALGSSESVVPDISVQEIRNGDSFLFSTDGMFRVLDISAVKNVLISKAAIEKKCEVLLERTLEGGAPDNVSLIILEPSKKGLLTRIFS